MTMKISTPIKKKKKLSPNQQQILKALKKHYPEARCALHFKNPLQLLVATQLSAQCTDKRVNQVTPRLFQKYKSAKDYAKAPLRELEGYIKSTGFFRNKARNLKTAGRQIQTRHKGRVPKDFESLVRLAGVGRKTAHVVMGTAFQVPSGVVVDTHVRRLSGRMGFVNTENVARIERELEALIPKKHWIPFSHWLIEHGRRICRARRPDCRLCFLADRCPKKGLS